MSLKSETGRTTFSSVWYGDRLLPIANACINSFKEHGHQFALYTYDQVEDVPAFVEQRDAEELFPRAKVFKAHGGWETFADQFAYQFLSKNGGWWVDNDVVCNSSAVPDIEIAFAEERAGIINNAVLKFPRKHPAIIALLEHVATIDPVNSQWGSTGPLALSKVFTERGLLQHKRSTTEFYPLHWREAPKLLFPEFRDEVAEKIQESPFVHLWGATLREVGFDFTSFWPIDGSYLHDLFNKNVDPHVRARLGPFDEGAFRSAVLHYVKESWGVDLPIRT